MKKSAVFLVVLLLLLAGADAASAVELKTDGIRAFDRNILTVTCEDGGRLTIEAFNGTVPLKNPVTETDIGPGTTEISWDGLTYGGEPVPKGRLTLRATLTCADRTTEQAEITLEAGAPKPAVVACLAGALEFDSGGKSSLRIEIAMSGSGTCEISIAAKGRPEEEIWHEQTRADAREPLVTWWDGKDRKRKPCAPGTYVISAWSKICPEVVQTAEITITEDPLPEPELAVTGSLIPEDLNDDAAVWAALTAPITVGNGPEGQGLLIMNEKGGRYDRAGTVACRTVGLAVLEIYGDGWVKVGAWRQGDGYYTEGYVKADKLRTVRPNTRYGAVVDKKAQTMTVYEAGRKLGTVSVSTGLTTEESRSADTHSGAFLLGTRMADFSQYKHNYCYPIRIDAYNLIHQAGYAIEDGQRNFAEETAALGRKASHGCIRVDARTTEENGGINAWWIWTHMGHDTKIIVTPED